MSLLYPVISSIRKSKTVMKMEINMRSQSKAAMIIAVVVAQFRDEMTNSLGQAARSKGQSHLNVGDIIRRR
jgi:hypothetical protein